MRLIRMNNRSRYKGIICMHCHKTITRGRAALCSTIYIHPGAVGTAAFITTFSWAAAGNFSQEVEVRFAYHRSCMEGILARGPLDPEVEASMFEQYRALLAERFGVSDEV